jgi:cytochrome c556
MTPTRMTRAIVFGLTLAGLLMVQSSVAEESDPEVVVHGRRANLRDLGAAFKTVMDEVKKPAPAVAAIKQAAHQIQDLSQQQRFWFPPGTGPQPDVETYAKPEIWQQPEKFKAAQEAFVREAAKLAALVDANQADQLKAQARTLGETCAGCHKPFRTPHDD